MLQALDAGFLLAFGEVFSFWWYVGSSPLRWAVYIVLVKELYAAIFQDYPGIRTVGRWSMYGALAVAGLVVSVFSLSSWRTHSQFSGHLYLFEFAERTLLSALVLFVVLLFLAVSRYPIRIPRSLFVNASAFCALFGLEVAALLVEWFFPGRHTNVINLILVVLNCLGYVVWAVLLRRPDTVIVQRPRKSADQAQEERLLGQLDLINQTLLRAVKK